MCVNVTLFKTLINIFKNYFLSTKENIYVNIYGAYWKNKKNVLNKVYYEIYHQKIHFMHETKGILKCFLYYI